MNFSRLWLAKVNNRIVFDKISCFIRGLLLDKEWSQAGFISPVIFLISNKKYGSFIFVEKLQKRQFICCKQEEMCATIY